VTFLNRLVSLGRLSGLRSQYNYLQAHIAFIAI